MRKFGKAEVHDWRKKIRSLQKRDQDQMLWNIVSNVENTSKHRSWMFLGQAVCRPAMFELTRASHRLKEFRKAQIRGQAMPPLDLRCMNKKATGLGPKARDVDYYLENLYLSAETIMYVKDCQAADVKMTLEAKPLEDQLVAVYDQALLDEEKLSVTHSTLAVQAHIGKAPTEGKRYLQPGTWTDEYRIYKADRSAKGLPYASWTVWWRVWTKNWKHKLQHRHYHFNHATCNQCIKYKTILKMVASIQSVVFWTTHYMRHLMSQHADRQCYYHERLQSVNTSEGRLLGFSSTVTIIIDAMGMASFKVPRHLPGSKTMSTIVRPQLHVVGVIAHGFHKAGYLFDPTIAKDANTFIEIMMITIKRIMLHCRQHRLAFPARFNVIADNAGDNKNTWTLTMNAVLTGSGLATTSSHLSLRTGHSHEDAHALIYIYI